MGPLIVSTILLLVMSELNQIKSNGQENIFNRDSEPSGLSCRIGLVALARAFAKNTNRGDKPPFWNPDQDKFGGRWGNMCTCVPVQGKVWQENIILKIILTFLKKNSLILLITINYH